MDGIYPKPLNDAETPNTTPYLPTSDPRSGMPVDALNFRRHCEEKPGSMYEISRAQGLRRADLTGCRVIMGSNEGCRGY